LCWYFFDDILIYSTKLSAHVQHLSIVLQVLKDNQLTAKRSKCEFGVSQVEYLGHVISEGGVETDPKKIEAMKRWPIPKCVKELRGFLDLTGYYRKFIRNYGTISRPLTELLKKNGFKWSESASIAFSELKQAMCTAPVLALPDFTKEFVLETDASDRGMGAVLMQEKRPVAYLSKALGIRNQALSTYEKELLALLTAVTKWRHYLQGKPFTIKTDHISLKHLLEQRLTHTLQHKGLCKLLGLDYKIEYKKGVENKAADALSRQPQMENCEKLMAVSEIIPSWLDELKESYVDDVWAKELLQEVNQGRQVREGISIHAGIIRKEGRIYVGTGQGWRGKIVQSLHDSSIGGHSDILGTYQRIKRIFYWPHLKKSISEHIQGCNVCQLNKGENVANPGLLQPIPIPEGPWSIVTMDFVCGLPKSGGKDVLLVVIDKFTKYCHLITLTHPFKAKDVAQEYLDAVYKLHGMPSKIITDRDPLFTSNFWQEIMHRLGVTLHFSTAYHPQTDGQSERLNQCIERVFKMYGVPET
jgi:RNase H-like domain found in reverse transcriptase/Integrase zinc binding domain/Integrase core domain/Reverse transcriptase (RNA-dependent DNA polymerase)